MLTISELQTKMIETMNDEQLKEYLLNRPKSLQSVKPAKSAPAKKVIV